MDGECTDRCAPDSHHTATPAHRRLRPLGRACRPSAATRRPAGAARGGAYNGALRMYNRLPHGDVQVSATCPAEPILSGQTMRHGLANAESIGTAAAQPDISTGRLTPSHCAAHVLLPGFAPLALPRSACLRFCRAAQCRAEDAMSRACKRNPRGLVLHTNGTGARRRERTATASPWRACTPSIRSDRSKWDSRQAAVGWNCSSLARWAVRSSRGPAAVASECSSSALIGPSPRQTCAATLAPCACRCARQSTRCVELGCVRALPAKGRSHANRSPITHAGVRRAL